MRHLRSPHIAAVSGIAPSREVVPLANLAPGESGTILEVDGQPDHVHRLGEMGLRPGRPVRMVRSGRACIVAVGNHRFGFRGSDAALILVEIGQPASAGR